LAQQQFDRETRPAAENLETEKLLIQENTQKEKMLIDDHAEKERLSFEKEKLLLQQHERATAEALEKEKLAATQSFEKEKLLIQQQKEVAAETLARDDLFLRQQEKAAALAFEDKKVMATQALEREKVMATQALEREKMMAAQALEEKKLLIQQQMALQNDNSEREKRLIELNEKQKREEREKIEIENQEKLKLSLQLAEEKKLRAIRETELKAELELEKQLREWEREQQPQLHRQTMKSDFMGDGASQLRAPNILDSSQVDVTQPVMAELHKNGDVSETSGDLLETSALPPRANLSVCQPTLAQASNLFDSKADSFFQTGTCLSQSDHKSKFLLSPNTNQPLAMHDTPSLAANEILTALPLATNHTITNYTHLHNTVIPAHTPLHNTDILIASPLSHSPNCGDSGHSTSQTIPSTGPGLAAVAQSTTKKLHTTPDNQIGRMSTADTSVTNLSAPHTLAPVQTTVGENNRHTLPPAVAPATQNTVTSGVRTPPCLCPLGWLAEKLFIDASEREC